ncbi:MAG: hypothetical protein OIN85_06855 [Candidatus Methanoperedens sp.]|nr:hypothetical protein [Candidatus Methanoperedens sp.]
MSPWILFLLIGAIVISMGCISDKGVEQGLNESLVKITDQEPDFASFIAQNPDSHPEITMLTPENISHLSKKYPALYGNLPNRTLYKLEYKGERGLLVIVDLENKKVLKYFRTAGVSLE